MRPKRVLEIALWALVALLSARFVLFSLWAASRLSNGFAAHYTASCLLLDGADVARFYDDAWFSARIADLAGPVYDLFRPNTPAAALLLLPVAWLDYDAARALWIAISVALLAGVALFFVRQFCLASPWLPGFVVMLLLFQPVYEQIAQGQNYLLMLALLVLAWHGYRRDSSALTGITLGLTLVLKLLGAYVLLLLILKRRWRAIGWAAGTAALVAIGSLPWIGVDAWLTYLREIPEFLSQPDLAVTAYQNQAGFIQHILAADPSYNPAPLLNAGGLASPLTWVAFSAVLAATLYAIRRTSDSDLAFSMAVLLNLILGPLSVDYQYTVALLPVALLLAWAKDSGSRTYLLLVALGVALIAADLPYRSPRLASGVWALLAYPKLYGAWLLWGVAVWKCVSVGRGPVPRHMEGQKHGGAENTALRPAGS